MYVDLCICTLSFLLFLDLFIINFFDVVLCDLNAVEILVLYYYMITRHKAISHALKNICDHVVGCIGNVASKLDYKINNNIMELYSYRASICIELCIQ